MCLRLVSPLLFLHLCWRSVKDGGWRYFKERLGYLPIDHIERIHVHAASVGEVITVLPLIEKLQSQPAPPAFLVTTNTPTGASILEKRLQGKAIHSYLPIDFPGATKRFFKRTKINNIWIVETEIWPWLYSQSNTPIAILNGRLSQKSEGAVANFFKQTYKRALSNITVLARSSEDANRYELRGVPARNIEILGNLKFAATVQSKSAKKLLHVPYVLAASTHEDEEVQLAKAWLNAATDKLLVIAPRHPDRGDKLIKQFNALQTEINPALPPIAQRSLGEEPHPNSQLYLADTLGELHDWYTHANAAFVGGSLIPRGGHNVLEPVQTKTPVVVGPHTFNFSEEVELLRVEDAIVVVDSATDATAILLQAITDAAWVASISARAANAINAKNKVLDKYCASLKRIVSNN